MAATSSKNKLSEIQKRLFASRFFTISVLIHFILVMTVGTATLIKVASQEPPDFTGGGAEDGGGAPKFVSEEPQAETPPQEQVQQPMEQAASVDVANVSTATPTASIDAITAAGAGDAAFVLPSMPNMTVSATARSFSVPTTTGPVGPGIGNIGADFKSLPRAQQVAIKKFTGNWAKGSGGPGSNPTQREFEFTAYLAKYRGGDWNSTNQISKEGTIVRGSLPNLLYLMSRRSKDRIKANPHAVPLDLSSDEIFTICPPFIFFTGHRDFVLTEKEVENLRKYVMLGGCIWGDSSLPGHRSRFDIAFRREMRRVIPDTDKDWEELPANHALYTRRGNLYYPEMTAPPAGLNYYAEPVYALKFAGEVAVIYTANDYGDMWQVGLTEDWKYDLSRDKNGAYVAMNGQIWTWREIYFRNVTEASVAATYKFGTNLVIHLITRWEDHVRNVPSSL